MRGVRRAKVMCLEKVNRINQNCRMDTNFTSPVDQLLRLGDVRNFQTWPDYLNMGIGLEHIPDLITMSLNQELNEADPESTEVWAPVHAWRLLGLLHAQEAVEALMSLFESDDDWVGEELPEVYGLIGSNAIPALSSYLSNPSHSTSARITAAFSLERIGNKNPEARAESINAITTQLESFEDNDPELNAFLISYLVDLKAVESAEVIEQAFSADCVDEFVVGDWEDVQIDLGLIESRTSPPSYKTFLYNPLTYEPAGMGFRDSIKPQVSKKAKGKSEKKRKMAKMSRKKNRRRH